MQFPSQWVIGEKVPFSESNIVEFKRVAIFSGLFVHKPARTSGLPKYKETLNAFLNSEGGYLLFGILDDGTISGVEDVTDDALDKFRLWVDSCFHSFIYKDGESLNPAQVSLTITVHPTNTDAKVIIVHAKNTGKPFNIMTKSGTMHYRLNASNYKVTVEPVYRKRDVKGMISVIQEQMQSTIDEKHRFIHELQDKHHDEIKEILQDHRECIEQISQSLYDKYHRDQNTSLCSRLFAWFGIHIVSK